MSETKTIQPYSLVYDYDYDLFGNETKIGKRLYVFEQKFELKPYRLYAKPEMSGKYIAVRFEETSNLLWQLSGYALDLDVISVL